MYVSGANILNKRGERLAEIIKHTLTNKYIMYKHVCEQTTFGFVCMHVVCANIVNKLGEHSAANNKQTNMYIMSERVCEHTTRKRGAHKPNAGTCNILEILMDKHMAQLTNLIFAITRCR